MGAHSWAARAHASSSTLSMRPAAACARQAAAPAGKKKSKKQKSKKQKGKSKKAFITLLVLRRGTHSLAARAHGSNSTLYARRSCMRAPSSGASRQKAKATKKKAKPKKAKSKKAFITLGSPVVPLLSTSKADSGLASEFRWDRAIYTAYERMLKAHPQRMS